MNLFLRILLVLLLLFVPFSFAGTLPWVFSVFQVGTIVLLAGILFSRRTISITPAFKWVVGGLGFLILYSLGQCVCTQTLLTEPAPYPATLMRLYTLEHVSYFITYLGWAFIVMQLADTTRTSAIVVGWIGVCAAAVAVTAQYLAKGEYIYALTGISGGYGPFLNRNHGGIFLVASAVLCLGWVCASFTTLSGVPTAQRKSFWAGRIWGLLVVLGVGVAAVFSRSRGGMLSLAVGLFGLAVLCALTLPATGRKRAWWLAGTLLVFGSSAYWAYTHAADINAFAHRRAVHDTSIETRKMLYRAAGDILHDYPVWGIGVGALPVVIPSYMEKRIPAYVERLHSDWLEMGVGLGYAGSIIMLVMLGGFAGWVWHRLYRLKPEKKVKLAALVGGLVAVCTGALADFPFFIPAVALLFFSMLGLTCSPSFWKGKIQTWQPRIWLRGLLAVIMLAACIVPLQKTLAWRQFLFGKNLKETSRLQYYEKGLSYYPGPRFALRLGLAYDTASHRAASAEEKARLQAAAHRLAAEYLQKYPKEKELSRLYIHTLLSGDK